MDKEARIRRAKLGYEKSKDKLAAQRARQKREAVERARNFKKSCKECDSSISYEKRLNTFCSYRCSGLYSNRHRSLESYQTKAKNPSLANCQTCGASLKGKSGKKYCSRRCLGIGRCEAAKQKKNKEFVELFK